MSQNGKRYTDEMAKVFAGDVYGEEMVDRNKQVGRPVQTGRVLSAGEQLQIIQQEGQNTMALTQMDNMQMQVLTTQAQSLVKDIVRDFDDRIDGDIEVEFVIKGRNLS